MKKVLLLFVLTLNAIWGFTQIACLSNYSGTFNNSSNPSKFIEYNGWLYFSAKSDGTGYELWRTNGTNGTTELFADIGTVSSEPDYFVVFQSELYFIANNNIDGVQIWKTNGTVEETVAVTQFIYPPGTTSASGIGSLILFNNCIYFVHAGELWKTNGTTSGTSQVIEIYPGPNSSLSYLNPEFEIIGTNLYFFADDGIHGKELWKSDGTAIGTSMVKDINVGSASSSPEYLTVWNDTLYFAAENVISGKELWKSDGTEIGTVQVADIYPGSTDSDPKYLTVSNNLLFFTAAYSTESRELWKSDGSTAGTALVKNIAPGVYSGEPMSLFDGNGTLYFSANDNVNSTELWKSDGTLAGTMMVKDIRPGGASDPINFHNYNGHTYFQANDGSTGQELWRTDGTVIGTTLVANIHSGGLGSLPSNFTNYNGKIVFSATKNSTINYEPWITDGTSAGTLNLRNIYTADNLDDLAYDGEVFKNKLYFDAYQTSTGRDLYSSSGTVASTGWFGNNITAPKNYYVVGNRMFFYGDAGVYRSNGTASSTNLVATINFPAIPTYLHEKLNGKFAYFTTNFTADVIKLYVCDSSSAPVLVKTIDDASMNGFDTYECVTMNNVLYFSMKTPTAGKELWRSDGTSVGTYLLKNIANGSVDGNPSNLTVCGNKLYFSANDGVHGEELWQSDGTTGGTILLEDIQPGSASSSPIEFEVFNDTLYFSVDDGINGRELWISDGTVSGTNLYTDFVVGPGSSKPLNLTSSFNGLYFSVYTQNEGRELWVKRTGETPEIVVDLGPGKFSGNPYNLKVIDNLVYFSANDEVHGYEPYVTLGSECSTSMIQDLNPGDKGSFPLFYGNTNGKIVIKAETDLNNTEIYSFNAPFQNTDTVLACQSYYWSLINDTIENSGFYSTILESSTGCDSIVSLKLIIGTPSNNVQSVTACSNYTWIDGITYTSSNSTATHTLTSITGCDSLVQLNLTINSPYVDFDTVAVCDSYFWGANSTALTLSGDYSTILTTVSGCDSVLFLNLTVNHSLQSTSYVSTCNSYTWVNGITYTSSTNTPTWHFVTVDGCDSVVTLNLTILGNSSVDVQTACGSYTWIDGSTYTSSTNTPTWALTNIAGCDSIITLNLTILDNSSIDTQTACESFTWVDGVTYFSSTNTPTMNYTNINGCDSIVTLNLTIQNSSGIDNQSACGSYTWIDGNTYTNSTNTPTWTLTNSAGCDSIVTLNLVVSTTPVATATDNGNATITASGIGAYQWIDCNTNLGLTGETASLFIPNENGTYAVIVDNGNCTDTSNCVTINSVSLVEFGVLNLKLFPNPTNNLVTISFEGTEAVLTIYDAQGKLIKNTQEIQSGNKISLHDVQTGVYFFEISTAQGKVVKRVVKN